ncbi:MAG: energy transducer TonB [Terracidiphilus sp.]|jgi:TonB family protein
MPVKPSPEKATFGLLPEPERSPGSFITSVVINGLMLAVFIYAGAMAKKTIDQHRYEETLLVLPAKKEPPKPKEKVPPPPPIEEPKPVDVKFEAPRINVPKPEPKPELKPIQIEAKLQVPVIKNATPEVVLGPQPKQVLAPAAMPAQDNHVKPSTKPVHVGDTWGVKPNPNAKGPATVAAIGNPYGGNQGPVSAPHGVVGSTGIGDGLKYGNNNGKPGGKVASAVIPATTVAAPSGNVGKVASVGIPTASTVVSAPRINTGPPDTDLVVIFKPQVEYTSEARQLKVQGDVILRVTFTASGQVVVHGIVQGLGHGLDEEARREMQQFRFRPATHLGQPVDKTTNVIITFQLA